MLKKKLKMLLSIRKKDGSELDLSKIRKDDRAIELITEVLNDKKDTSTKWVLDEIWEDVGLLKLLSMHPIRLQFPRLMDPKVLFDLVNIEGTTSEDKEKGLEAEILRISDDIQRIAKYALPTSLEQISGLFEGYGTNIRVIWEKNQVILKLPEDASKIIEEVTELKKTLSINVTNVVGILHHYLIRAGLEARHELLRPLGLKRKDYHKLIEKLRGHFVILPLFSLYLCLKHPEHPQYAIEIGSRTPPNMKCSFCDGTKNEVTGIFYSFEPRISEMISRNGGILPCAVMWFLEKNGIAWLPDVELDGPAKPKLDILAKCNKREEYVLLEMKCREIQDKPKKIIDQFQSGVKRQFVPALSSCLDKDVPLIRGYLLTNYPDCRKRPFKDACIELEKEALRLLKKNTSSDIPADFKVKVLGLENIKDTLCNRLNIED